MRGALRRSGRYNPGRAALFLAAGSLAFLTVRGARADEPIKASEPSLMAEPGEVVDVIDAFDTKNNDPFDLNLSLGLSYSSERGKIKRESNIGPNGELSDAGFVHNIEPIASYKHSVTTLNMRADIGLFRDLALFLRIPLIIADDRSLDDLDGSTARVNKQFGRASDTANGAPFFNLPFSSPTRSGIDYIAAGLRYSIFNQHRDPTKPTWTVELEGRFGIGEPLHACNANPEKNAVLQQLDQCPDPSNFGFDDKSGYFRKPGSGRTPGISRGTNAIRFGTLSSYRYRYVEPYGGFWFMAEFQKHGTDMGDAEGLIGVITNHPPLRAGLVSGLMIHPWENREAHQRFTIDLRFDAQYVSQGRDYSPLFDALGSSNAPSLIAPNPGAYRTGPPDPVTGQQTSVGDYSRPAYFTGVTDVEAYGIFGGKVGFILYVAQHVRFGFGVGLSHVQAHLVTASDACNPNIDPAPGSEGRCRQQATSSSGNPAGVPNPYHRPNIDLPGRRFRISETFLWETWINGTMMF